MVVWLWVGFIAFVCFLLGLDLGVFNRKAHVIRTKEALYWSAFWIGLALLFNVGIYFLYQHHIFGIGEKIGHNLEGREAAMLFFTGYVIEKSLSLDNIFVIALIFAYFKVPGQYQHRVLFWGVLGALIMRGLMIWAGAELIERFSWTLYIFGGVLIVTAIKMLMAGDEEPDLEKNIFVRIVRKLFPISPGYEGQRFFTRIPVAPSGQYDGGVLASRFAITPMFLVLLVIEGTDVVFAVDSIPAIFGITQDPFIVFTSNVFAILGLRSLFFALAAMLNKFQYLKTSLVFVLVFIGGKMIAEQWYQGRHPVAEGEKPHHLMPTEVSLAIVVAILATGVIASLIKARRDERQGKA